MKLQLHYSTEDDLFWEFDRLDKISKDVKKHLDLESRHIKFENHLDHAKTVYKDQSEYSHSVYGHHLEWIIIGLIACGILVEGIVGFRDVFVREKREKSAFEI